MPLWSLTLAYDGTSFHGWQVQPHLPTIQGTLAQALHHLTGEQVLPQGSGRTDAGVHALAQMASFNLEADIPPDNLLRALNRALPPSIRVLEANHAPAGYHARHAAVRKTYEYRIFPARRPSQVQAICPPMLAPYVWDCAWPIDCALAQAAAAAIVGTHDFTSFAAVDPEQNVREAEDNQEKKSAVRSVDASTFTLEPPLLVYRVTGSGFLHHMVRNLVGTFVEIGRGQPLSISAILAARSRTAAGPTAPARGLFLHSVEYSGEPAAR